MDLISVIVPVYNVERYLQRCVDSIRNQSYPHLEIILVEDGSPDCCGEICDALALQDSRIKVIHKSNEGLGLTRNAGLNIATGAYAAFIDSDDWISPDHIENLYQIAKQSGAELVMGAHTAIQEDGSIWERPVRMEKEVQGNSAILEELLLPIIAPDVDCPQEVLLEASSCMNLYRMDLIRKYNIRFLSEREAISEDLYFNLDFLFHSNCVVLKNELGYYYYENQQSISRRYDPEQFARILRSCRVLRERMECYGLSDRISCRIERYYLLKIRVVMRQIVFSAQSAGQKWEQIKQILDHPDTQNALNVYPVNTYIPALRLYSSLMRAKSVLGIYCLIRFRELARRTKLLRAALKKIGLGK